MRIIKLLLLILVMQGCKKLYFNEPDNTPVNNFEIFWKDFDRYYGQFDIRHVNWDSVYEIYHRKINANTTDKELFSVFNNMIQSLRDGHVNLYTPIGVAGYNVFPYNYFGNQLINPNKYISFSTLQNSAIEFGTIHSSKFGYIFIGTFYSNEFGLADPRFNLIDDILQQYKDKDGIIIDVRSNGGGNSANAVTIASRFADSRRLYYKQRFRNGPAKNDYSDWIDFYIEPQGKIQFTKPVVLLTSRCTYSAAELFTSAMSVLPNVTIVGDTTAGGIGDPVYRELLNGWSYRLSTSVGAMANGNIIDGNGIIPQVVVSPAKIDSITPYSRDIMLEKAIQVLNSK